SRNPAVRNVQNFDIATPGTTTRFDNMLSPVGHLNVLIAPKIETMTKIDANVLVVGGTF
ncbi:1631_t:CDS:1, partial [Entrophospora sp. SA101]